MNSNGSFRCRCWDALDGIDTLDAVDAVDAGDAIDTLDAATMAATSKVADIWSGSLAEY